MKAMVLAAGFGTRLGEAGKITPKCLFEAGGKTLLEHVLARLKQTGVNFVVINTHHLAEKVRSFIASRSFPGLEIHLSHETEILGTGGGLRNARPFFEDAEHFFVHNADVYCELDLGELLQSHASSGALATIAVKDGAGEKALLVDQAGKLKGWIGEEGQKNAAQPGENLRRVDLLGIHVVSRGIFDFMNEEQGMFSIIRPYMNAVSGGRDIRAFDAGGSFWLDAGTPQALENLRTRLVKE